MAQPKLDAIGLKYGADKASTHHNYLNFYELFFSPIRNNALSILEIGVLKGQSLSVWAEYFPKARIVGVDIVPESRRFAADRISIEIADQSNARQLRDIGVNHGPFHIIIEDGSHMCDHQITSLRTLFPFLAADGIYIVEDLQTNYGALLNDYKGSAAITCVDFLKSWLDILVGDEQVDVSHIQDDFLRAHARTAAQILFYPHACLIRKRSDASALYARVLNDDSRRAASKGITILAHFAFEGDLRREGFISCINNDRSFEIQGISISSELNALEYRVQYQDGHWGDWVAEGVFAGTRGRSEALKGVAARVKASLAKKFSVRTTCAFAGVKRPKEAVDGGAVTTEAGHALTSIQIDLISR